MKYIIIILFCIIGGAGSGYLTYRLKVSQEIVGYQYEELSLLVNKYPGIVKKINRPDRVTNMDMIEIYKFIDKNNRPPVFTAMPEITDMKRNRLMPRRELISGIPLLMEKNVLNHSKQQLFKSIGNIGDKEQARE